MVNCNENRLHLIVERFLRRGFDGLFRGIHCRIDSIGRVFHGFFRFLRPSLHGFFGLFRHFGKFVLRGFGATG